MSPPITLALKGQKPKGGGKNFDSPTRQNLISTYFFKQNNH
jgi:hypothetical protein